MFRDPRQHDPAAGTGEAPSQGRVGVLTFHRCINYGSYWQARCLVEGLRAMGADAVLLDHQAAEITSAEWRCAFRPTLPLPTPRSDFPAYGEKLRRFLDAFAALPLSPPFPLHHPAAAGHFDAVVVGSDEVWNLRHPWYGGRPLFFGEGLNTPRLIAYAASFGNHDAEDGIDAARAASLRRFAAISVRDENSRRILAPLLAAAPELVLDPCLLFPPALPPAAPLPGKPYVALYGHGFPEWLMAELRCRADERGLRIVSIGYRNRGADAQCLSAGPEEFARLMAGASTVVTNFFHGCIFALLNCKPLVTAPSAYRLNKVRDLLQALGGSEHMVDASTPPEHIARLFDRVPSAGIQARIETLRASSRAFLRQSLALPA